MSEIKPEYKADYQGEVCTDCGHSINNHGQSGCLHHTGTPSYKLYCPCLRTPAKMLSEARAWARRMHRRAMVAEKEARAWAQQVNQQMQEISELKRERER
jgi:hypothetical protein